MILKRLIEILKTFDKDELKRFGRFIDSNYFNTNERIAILFKSLKKFYPEFESNDLNAQYLTFRTFMELCNLTQSLNVLRQNLNAQPGDNAMYVLTSNIDYKGMIQNLEKLEKETNDKNRKIFLNSLKIFVCYLVTFISE